MNEYALTLDLAKAKQRQQQTIFVRQGDRNATTIVATITDHGVAASTSGMTARFSMRLPNGTEYYRKTATLSGSTVTVTIDEAQAASAVGRTDVAYFQLLQGSTVVASTESFTIVVLPDALADAEVAESYDSAIQDAIDALDAAVEQMPDMVEDVLADHPEWTTTVQDGSITEAKLATDLARDRERLLYRLDNLLTNALPEGDVATASDAAKTPMAGLSVYGQSTQDGTPTPSAPVPIVSVEGDASGNISLWARGRNLYHQTVRADGSSETVNGATFTYVGENSMAVSGSPTSNTWKPMSSTETNAGYYVTLSAGTYTASKGTTLGRIYVRKLKNGAQAAIGNSAATSYTFTLTEPTQVAVTFAAQASETYDNTLVHLQIEVGDTAHAYEPYTETVTPIPLDGHELRSLPDGTRDEVTVGADGHAVLVQRVASATLSGASSEGWSTQSGGVGNRLRVKLDGLPSGTSLAQDEAAGYIVCDHFKTTCDSKGSNSGTYWGEVGISARRTTDQQVLIYHEGETLANWLTWLASNPITIDYALATPVTHDLGTVPLVPLVGPDLTAQAVPSAPFALTYERDLNVTLARLESAIATLA